MNLLIYLTVASAIFILADFILNQAVPSFIASQKRWQEKRAQQMSSRLEESFIFMERWKALFIGLFPFIFSGIGFLVFRNLIALTAGFLLGLSLPNMIIRMAWQGRMKKLRGQLVDSIMILSSCLKAGFSIVQAIETLCEEMPAPVSQEFGLVLKENKLGISLDDSLRLLRRRVQLEEVNLLVSSILVAKESGGEITKVLSRLTETIRNNLKLKEKIATLTLQGRLQGIIMSLLPPLFTWYIYQQNPHHFDVMLETHFGRMLLIGAVFAQIVGMYMIKKISTIRI